MDNEENIVKKGNYYHVSDDIFAIPCISEDGQEMMIAARYNNKSAYFRFTVAEIPKDNDETIFQAAALLALGYMQKDDKH